MRNVYKIAIAAILSVFITAMPVFAQEGGIQNLNGTVQQAQIAQQNYENQRKSVSGIIDEVNPSVVAIIGENKDYRTDEQTYSKYPQNLQFGSGVVIESTGKILTNNHVIDGLEDIYVVTYDGNVYKAEMLYTDKDIDLALLKINRNDMKPMKLADQDSLKIGDDVIAIGTPLFFSYRNSASKGIISGLNRPVDGAYMYLQTDAAVNPGNSGGPLVNMEGELVGINTLGYMYYQGMNFSIPVDNINYFIDHYNKYGKIKRCYTGIEFEENWAAMLGIPTNQGLKVVAIQDDAAVSSGQVMEGDLLDGIDGSPTTSIAQYNEILKKHLPGDSVKMTFSRNGKTYDLTVTLKEMPEENK